MTVRPPPITMLHHLPGSSAAALHSSPSRSQTSGCHLSDSPCFPSPCFTAHAASSSPALPFGQSMIARLRPQQSPRAQVWFLCSRTHFVGGRRLKRVYGGPIVVHCGGHFSLVLPPRPPPPPHPPPVHWEHPLGPCTGCVPRFLRCSLLTNIQWGYVHPFPV